MPGVGRGLFRNPPQPQTRRITSPRLPWLDYIAELRKDNAAFAFPMDESAGGITDVIGGLTGTTGGSPTYGVTGPINGHTAIDFAAAADAFSVPDNAALDIAGIDYTISAWVTRDTDQATLYECYAYKGVGSYVLGVDPEWHLYLSKKSTGFVGLQSDVFAADGTWHHVVWTVTTGGVIKLYVDAKEQTLSYTKYNAMADTTDALIIGNNPTDSYWGGKVAYFSIIKSAISHDRIQAHFLAAPVAPILDYESEIALDNPVFVAPMDEASGNLTDIIGALTGTPTGSPTYGVTGPVVGHTGMVFPTVSDYITFPDNAALDIAGTDVTIEVWYGRDTDTATWQGILAKNFAWGVSVDPTDYLSMTVPGTTQLSIAIPAVPTDSVWRHFVVQRRIAPSDMTELTTYINAVQSTLNYLNVAYGAFVDNTNDLTIGTDSADGAPFNRAAGRIAYVAIYKSWLPPERIARHYAARDVAAAAGAKSLAFADAVTNSTAWTRTATLARSFADSTTISTAWSRVLTAPRAFADAVTTSDTWAAIKIRAMAFADSLTVSTAWTRVLTLSRAVADSVTVSTAWTRALTLVRAISDSVTISDAWVRVLTAVRSWADAVTVSTSWTRVLTLARAFADTVTVGTAWARVLTAVRSFADSVTTSDAWTRVATLARDFADNVTASADHILEKMGVKTLAFADAVTTSDAWTRVATLARSISDAVTSADAWSRALTLPRTFADAVTTSDAWSRAVTAVRTFADAVTTSDAAEFVKQGGAKVLDFADAVTTSDAWSRVLTLVRDFADAVTTSDAWARMTALLAGFTRNASGAVIPNIQVDVFRADDNTFFTSTFSDANGHYQVTVIPGVAFFIVAYDVGLGVYGVTARDLVGT